MEIRNKDQLVSSESGGAAEFISQRVALGKSQTNRQPRKGDTPVQSVNPLALRQKRSNVLLSNRRIKLITPTPQNSAPINVFAGNTRSLPIDCKNHAALRSYSQLTSSKLGAE